MGSGGFLAFQGTRWQRERPFTVVVTSRSGLALRLALTVVVVACSGVPLDRTAEQPPGASPTPGFNAGRCQLNDAIRIDESRPAYSFIGGRLAANVNAAGYLVTSVDKSIWAIRTAEPPARLNLVRERLDAAAPPLDFVGMPIQHGDDSALPQWGPTYFVELRFPSTGCWRLRLRDGQPGDFIVFYVIRGSSSP